MASQRLIRSVPFYCRGLLRALRMMTFVLALFISGVGALVALSHVPFVEAGSLLSGLGYATDVILFPALVLSCFLCSLHTSKHLKVFNALVLVACLLTHADARFFPQGSAPAVARAPSTSASLGAKREVSVQAVNLRYYSFGAGRLVDFFRTNPVDFVFLSENTAGVSEFQDVWKRIPGASMHSGRVSETAFLSRWPLTSFREVELPSRQASLDGPNDPERQGENPQRAFVHAVANVQGTLVNILSVRFVAGRPASSHPADGVAWGRYLLREQRKELDAFKGYLAHLEGPVIFGGDLNATPGSFVVRALSEIAEDSWLSRHGFGAATFPTLALFPFARLDFLFGMRARPVDAFLHADPISDHAVLESRFALSTASI